MKKRSLKQRLRIEVINVANTPPPLRSWVILGAAVLAVSSAGAVFQLMNEVPPLLRASWRLQATALLLLPPFLYQLRATRSDLKMRKRLSNPRVWLIVTGSGLFLWIHFGAWVWSLDHTSLTHSLLLVTAHPLVIVIGCICLSRPISAGQMRGALLGFAGVALTLLGVHSEGSVTLIGDLAAFIGAVAIVGYLSAGRVLRPWMPLFIYAFPVTLIASLMLAISSLLLEETSLATIPPSTALFGWAAFAWLPYVAYLALGPGIVGHTGINASLRWLPPLVISVSVLFEPILGTLLGWMLGTVDDPPGLWTWAGGLLLLAGLLLVTLSEGDDVVQIDGEA